MANITCEKCNKNMDEKNYYTYKDGSKTEMCKACMTMHIDNFDPDTFLWLLEKMDVPYIPEEWNTLRDRAYMKNPNLNGTSVFGKYLSKMKLKQWKKYSWADTEKLMEESKKRREEYLEEHPELKNREQDLKVMLERGEINQAQYQTLMSNDSLHAEEVPKVAPMPGQSGMVPVNPLGGPTPADTYVDPALDLTEDDKKYLIMKWGRLYKPSEWLELEEYYTKMTNSFDIQDADTDGTLKLICKTYLKMNQAVDIGDIDSFNKLSRTYESLRKSAKFTAAQNKEQSSDFVDSIGEFVELCEREEGFIPRFATDIPQDKVDLTLKDMEGYLHKLVTKDLGFGQQIENALKKIQIQKEMNDKANEEIKDGDFIEFYDDVQEQKDQDMVTMYGGGEE